MNLWGTEHLILGAVLTVLGSLLFTDAVELLAIRFNLTTSITGAVISPLLTSLPELFVFITAVFINGSKAGENVGLGTVIGEPFMASTLIYPLLIIASLVGYLTKRRKDCVLHPGRELVLPFLVVTLLFPLVALPDLLSAIVLRYVVGALLILFYFVYVALSTKMGSRLSEIVDDVPHLTLLRLIKSERIALAFQLLVSVIMIAFGSRFLVSGVISLSRHLGVSAQAVSIVIVPSVAALPESLTGLIWAYRGRDTLAIASIVGEKVLYSTFYPGLAAFTVHVKLELCSLYCILVTVLISLLMLYYVYRGRVGFEAALIGLTGYAVYILLLFLHCY